MFSNPDKNLKALWIMPGMAVADFGTGTGFYALAAARMVLPEGKVYAVEVQKDLLERLKKEAVESGFHNISVVWGDIEKLGGSHLKDFSVDAVFVSNVLFQAEDRSGLAKEVKRILKPDGKVLLIDWSEGGILGGPSTSSFVRKGEAVEIFSGVGLEIVGEVEAGSHHYGVIFKKPKD